MLDATALPPAFVLMFALAMLGWVASVFRRDVSIVDSLWSLFFLAGTVAYAVTSGALGPDAPASSRTWLVLGLVTAWALRLAGYLAWRNANKPEDRRYAAMRSKRGDSFWWRSLYVVFGLQFALAAVIIAPLLVAVGADAPLGWVDAAGVALWVIGFGFETVGDAQLARFKADPANRDRVMDRGLWRFTRHPNYFGEAALWWGYYLLAITAGGAWTVFAPVLMTWLLLKVSGVALLERDIGARRPAYAAYAARTSAFLPRPPGRAA